MKGAIAILSTLIITACTTKPFVRHSVSFEKLRPGCAGISPSIRMNSNLNGERFEFQLCLDADFRREQVTSLQKGDTVVIRFERKNKEQDLYNITLDVDAYPRYPVISIDGNMIQMKAVGN